MSLLDMRIDVDDYFPSRIDMFHRRSNSMPFMHLDEQPSRSSISYCKLPDEPLRLSVLKLDGSCFEILVVKSATVAELKEAVQDAFSYVPRRGPEKISWPHVWGHFCLCFDGKKLLKENACIIKYGIRDGDQLQFIRHISPHLSMMKNRSMKWLSASEPTKMSLLLTNSKKEQEQNDDQEVVDSYDDAGNGRLCCNRDEKDANEDNIIERNGTKLVRFFSRCVPSYSRVPTMERMRIMESPPPPRSSCGFLCGLTKMLRICTTSRRRLRDY